jgi:hypothetical protein
LRLASFAHRRTLESVIDCSAAVGSGSSSSHTCSALRRSGVGYDVKVPELLVVRGTDQYF